MSESDPRPVFEARLVFKARLLFEEIRYTAVLRTRSMPLLVFTISMSIIIACRSSVLRQYAFYAMRIVYVTWPRRLTARWRHWWRAVACYQYNILPVFGCGVLFL